MKVFVEEKDVPPPAVEGGEEEAVEMFYVWLWKAMEALPEICRYRGVGEREQEAIVGRRGRRESEFDWVEFGGGSCRGGVGAVREREGEVEVGI